MTEMGVGGTLLSGGSGSTTTTGLVWQHTNVWAGGKLLATYDSVGLHFYFDDPLGTRRAQTDASGVLEQTCSSLPYGDQLSCVSQPDTGGNISPYIASITAPTEHHFTGKERDVESGNDYFEARYYSSSMGRFMSPDWSVKEEPIPYAKLGDPQTLNLYAYVGNNPMTRFDADGHDDNLVQRFLNWLIFPDGWKADAGLNQIGVARTAQNHVNSMDWAVSGTNISGLDSFHLERFKSTFNKCNEFVGDVLSESGHGRPMVLDAKTGKLRMPTAHEYADPNIHIIGLSEPKPLSEARPGDVIAQEHGSWGHVGILALDKHGKLSTVSANSYYDGRITQNDWGLRPRGNIKPGQEGPNGESASDPAPVVRHVQ